MKYRLVLMLSLVFVSFIVNADQTSGLSKLSCNGGRLFNPVADPAWSNAFPITILGVPIGGSTNPPEMNEPPVCLCPSKIYPGVSVPGVGVSFWEPLYVAEVDHSPGCLRSIGGKNVLGSGFQMLTGDAKTDSQGSSSGGGYKKSAKSGTSRKQVHWYKYPIFAMLNSMESAQCASLDGFALANMTELDPTFQNDLWGVLFTPEASLFATYPLQLACIADAAATAVGFPINALFWCTGAAGGTYPFTGNVPSVESHQMLNHLVLAKAMSKMHRVGALWGTTGPLAQCSSFPSPFLIKTQYRLDEVWPARINKKGIYLGQTEFVWGLFPPANYPTREGSVYLIWQGKQCCERS